MRMLKSRRRLDLGEKSFGAECGAEVFVQHFDCDVAVVLEVVREIHGRHPARAELALDAVSVRESVGETPKARHGSAFPAQTARGLREPVGNENGGARGRLVARAHRAQEEKAA